MSQEEENTPPASERLYPQALTEWKQRVGATGTGRAWADFTILLNHYTEALNRAPYTAEACDQVNIVELINTEFAYLAEVLAVIFPDGSMTRKEYNT